MAKRNREEFKNNALYDEMYHDQDCIVCGEKIRAGEASNGWMHKACEMVGTTGQQVFLTPTATSPVQLGKDGVEQ